MPDSGLNYCCVIPCYRHAFFLEGVLLQLLPGALPLIVVDDGNTGEQEEELRRLELKYPGVKFIHLKQNQGKGGALLAGFDYALSRGFTHALQVDADGQHDISRVPDLMAASQRCPEAVVSGFPRYDSSAPKSRRYGRMITNFWTALETWSLDLKESMLGFRVYPLAALQQVSASCRLGRGMDFDIEILVRLKWAGLGIIYVEVPVIYPEHGFSNFDALRDNLKISRLHARLFFTGLYRKIFCRKAGDTDWAHAPEQRGLIGMKILLRSYALFGRTVFELMLYPVILFYWIFSPARRNYSRTWLKRAVECGAQSRGLNSYAHFLSFGISLLDKIAAWRGDLKLGREIVFAPGAREVLNGSDQRGRVVLGSHLGLIEVCRAAARDSGRVVNALIFTENSRRFTAIMHEFAPEAEDNVIAVQDIGVPTALLLADKLEKGEWAAILADRVPPAFLREGKSRVCRVPFCGREAAFPQGPFILAALLGCPVLLVFGLRRQGKIEIHAEEFAPEIRLGRQNREAELKHWIERYASRLEHFALQYPLQWFNFYDFWAEEPHGGRQ